MQRLWSYVHHSNLGNTKLHTGTHTLSPQPDNKLPFFPFFSPFSVFIVFTGNAIKYTQLYHMVLHSSSTYIYIVGHVLNWQE